MSRPVRRPWVPQVRSFVLLNLSRRVPDQDPRLGVLFLLSDAQLEQALSLPEVARRVS